MAENPKEKRKRAPKRCLKCPDKPLLSTCALHRFRKPKPVEVPQEEPQRQPQAPLQPVLPQSPDPPLSLQAGLPSQQVPAPADESTTTLATPSSNSPPSSPSPSSALSRAGTPSSPNPPSPSGQNPGYDESSVEEEDSDDEVGQKRKSKGQQYRRQPSGRNATWGVVEGAGRGSEPYPIHRVRELKPVISSQRKATKDLDRWTADLLSRCESISTRTGCWLYLAMQHPASRTPFVHFTSRKLRKDAPEHVRKIHNEVRLTMNALTRADRRARVEVESELQMTQQKLASAEKRAEDLESKLDALLERLARHENSSNLGVHGGAFQRHEGDQNVGEGSSGPTVDTN
ncbi:hypothetical protein CC1G_10416 [Coprinopsis cinerea okayama7|uniref:Uncharacterized protein n=1 Tax=Coprinopsis cinerea (strain Okayama-7 / 130 / ATCC MYA-4618 / FGSC 9003) TaxID=240176 RepID=A8PAQ5_COPC7|nr:hypothetical protein CC1G_10416 [Coprinopsis cinerea okayama7\|eukprot:XP_001840032.1 hypothetical protein CC1G_10416 [Coprinopsis cinerea okayama7\